MTPTTIAAIIGAALSVGIAVVGAIAGIRKRKEQERREAEIRQKEHEARLKNIERMYNNGNNNGSVMNAYPQYLAQPTSYAMPQQSTVTVNHYLHGQQQTYVQPPIMQTQPPVVMQTINQPPHPQMNYGYGYGGGYHEPVWSAERIYGRGGGYNTPLNAYSPHISNYAYAYA